MDKNYKVYKHTFPNEKVYIGITKQIPEKRWLWGYGYNCNSYMQNAINKYGWNNIKHEILFDNLTKEEAEQKEIELIAFYKSNQRKFGYNIANGGFYHNVSDETRQKMSNSAKGKIISEQAKQKLHLKNGGCNNPMFNKKHTPEALAKIIASIKRKPVVCIETNIKYNSIMDCSKMTGISETAISRNCKGLRKQAKGFHFKFI